MLFLGGDVDLYGYCLNDPINLIDPYGLDWLDDLANVSAGFGDTLTFGATKWIREKWNQWADLSDSVDPCSGFYKAGKWSAYAWDVAFAVAGASKLFLRGAKDGWHFGKLGYHSLGKRILKNNLGKEFVKFANIKKFLHLNIFNRHVILKAGKMIQQIKYWRFLK